MKRREFITLLGGAAAWPHAARAQQPRLPVVGWLGARSATADANYIEAFRRGLAEGGFVPGQNVAIEFRWADYRLDRLPAFAAELVQIPIQVLVTAGTAAAPAAKAVTSTIPIVFSTGTDPVKTGLVQSLAHPSSNLTGATTLNRELNAKRLGLLRDLVREDAPLGHIIDPGWPDSESEITEVQEAANQIGHRVMIFRVRTEADIEAAFATMAERAVGGAVITGANLVGRSGLIVSLATCQGLPAVYTDRAWAVAGGLMAYNTSIPDTYHTAGLYTARILKGAKPTDLPVLLPTKFELVINLNTANALKLIIPSGIMAIADEVIE